MPIFKPAKPLSDKLPRPVKSIIDTFFPPDDVMGPAMPGTVIGGASKGLLEALAPLLKGSLRRGQEIAPEVLQSLPSYLPEKTPKPRDQVAREFFKTFWNGAPQAPNVHTLAAMDKVTGSRPMKAPKIDIPEDFTMSPRGRRQTHKDLNNFGLKRDPVVEKLNAVWTRFENYNRDGNRTVPRQQHPDRPKLSGRWNYDKRNPARGTK
jgi:hypothetical protein